MHLYLSSVEKMKTKRCFFFHSVKIQQRHFPKPVWGWTVGKVQKKREETRQKKRLLLSLNPRMETHHVSPERVVYFINTPGHRPQHFVQCFTKELRYHFDLSVNAPICHSVCNTHTHTVFATTVLTLAEHKRLFRLGDFIFYLLSCVPLCF